MQIPSSEQKWLSIFFNSPNDIRLTSEFNWAKNNDFTELTTEVQLWIELFCSSNKSDIAFVIPFASKGITSWYACFHDFKQQGRVVDELKAFFENSYAHIEQVYSHNELNPCELTIQQRFGKNVIKIEVIDGNDQKIVEILSLYRQVLTRRPKEEKNLIRPTGRIRYEFEQALAAGDDFLAGKCIDELKSTGRLDQLNLRFLEIRRFASFGKWDLLASNPEFLRSVIDLHLPSQIQGDLIQAVYFTFLYSFELSSEPEKAVEAFKKNILPNYSKLFKSRRGNKSPIVLKAFLINEIARDATTLSHCQSILADYRHDAPGYQYAAKLLELVPDGKDHRNDLMLAEEAFEDEKFDFAFSLFVKQEPTRKVLQRILYCVQEIQTIQAIKDAWNYSNKVSDEVISSLPAKSKQLFVTLGEQYDTRGDSEVADWCELFEYVLNKGDENRGLELAKKGSDEWVPDLFINNQQKISTLTNLLGDCLDYHPIFFKKILPSFYTFFFANEKLGCEFKCISVLLVQFIALFDSWTTSDLGIAHDLLRVSLDASPTDSEYKDIVDSVSEIYSHVKSPKNLTWALDIAELLAIYPAPQTNNRIILFANICSLLGEIKHRVCKEEWSTLEFLAKDYGFGETIDGLRPVINDDVAETGILADKLAGKKIGIYTLTEPAGMRAKIILESFYDGVHVETNCDHEATERLTNLAKTADLFVFAWKSSKHQAFYCVQSNIKDKNNLLMPLGKGSTSIVRSVTQSLEQQYGN